MAQHEGQSTFVHWESRPMGIPPATFEAGSYLQKPGEEVTRIQCLKLKVNIDY